MTVNGSVTLSGAQSVLVDFEVYDPQGRKVCQTFFDNQSFTAGQKRTYTFTCSTRRAAAKGTYTVKIGIFTPGWGSLYHWNDNAAQFTVQ